MKPKKFYKKLNLGKLTIANLDNRKMLGAKGGRCYTDPAPTCVSENPDCDTLSDCNVTEGKPYYCPSEPPTTCWPGCPSVIC